MLKINNLSKSYNLSGRKVVAVDSVNLNIAKGKIVAIIGPNGAGKTTLIKTICGLVIQTKGDIELDDISSSCGKKYLKNLGVVLEGARNIFWRLTPHENIDFMCRMHGLPKKTYFKKIMFYLDALDLTRYRDVECRYLSKGNQQKTAIACIMALGKKLILLDEPTLGLDVEIAEKMIGLINNEKLDERIIIITGHDMEFIENIADVIIVIYKGKIRLISNPTKMKAKYGSTDKRLSTAYINMMKDMRNGLY